MDPSKSATAPPTDFSGGEKSSMGQSAPPPYYDNPGAGHFNPGYPAQAQVRARLEAGLRVRRVNFVGRKRLFFLFVCFLFY